MTNKPTKVAFATLVSAFLLQNTADTLADEFEVSVATVLGWADGSKKPHPRMKVQIGTTICALLGKTND